MFENALKYSLKWEGGFVDHPMDKGGPTNKGITIHTLSAFRKRECTIEDIKNIQDQEARAIYKTFFWDPLSLEYLIDEPSQIAIFDIAINRGNKRSAKYAQLATNMILSKNNPQGVKPLIADGILGSRSIEAINSVPCGTFLKEFYFNVVSGYTAIVRLNPTQKVFLKGWLNRANALLDLA